MEVSCPNCRQRLRYPDHLRNPLLRCKTCQTTFRPAEAKAGSSPGTRASPIEDPVDELEEWQGLASGDERTPVPARTPQPLSVGAKGLGSFGLIALLLAIKIVPRLVREVFREPQPPPPVQIREQDRQAMEKLLREARENAEEMRENRRFPRPAPNPMP